MKNSKQFKHPRRFFEGVRLEVSRILIEELEGWASTTKVETEEFYRLVDRLASTLPARGKKPTKKKK